LISAFEKSAVNTQARPMSVFLIFMANPFLK